MPERNYQDRDVLDKLGIRPGHTVAFAHEARELDPDMRRRVIERTGRPPATEDEVLDIVLAIIDETSDAVAVLKKWRTRLAPNGGIWLLTAKRGQPGYVDQHELIAAGQQAEVVDNTDGGSTWSSETQISSYVPGYYYLSSSGYELPYGDYFQMSVDNTGSTQIAWGEGSAAGPGNIWTSHN